jgi:hypothetical protein
MPASLDFTDKKLSRELLKGVKKTQWRQSLNRKGSSYFNLSDVTKKTDKAIFISTPTHSKCNDGFWIPKSVCLFRYENHWSNNSLVRVTIEMPYSFTTQGKDEAKNGGFSAAHAIANFATKNRTDIYCNA